jgi:hypothetical protein
MVNNSFTEVFSIRVFTGQKIIHIQVELIQVAYWNVYSCSMLPPIKIRSLVQLFDLLPENERIIVDVLRQIVLENLPESCSEKISYNVPFFYGNKGICIIWPSTIPRGGIREGVLLGFWYGNRLKDVDGYLQHGTNKQIFYKIFKRPEEINEKAIVKLLREAVKLDQGFASSGRHTK